MPTLAKSDEGIRVKNSGETISVGYAFQKGNCLRIGDGYYTIIRPIGKGGVGDVYEVMDIKSREHFAMKHLYHQYATDPMKYHGKLRLLAAHAPPHPCFTWILEVSDFDIKTKSFCYIMPLVPKGFLPLARAINDRKLLTMDQRLFICKQLAEAFAQLQKKKWVYGDCSAKNILFKPKRNGNPEVLIIDCDTITTESAPFGLEGTGCYRAPEIFLGKHPTLNSDAHALAAVLFHLLIGTNPLDGTKTRKDHFSEATVLHHFGEDPVYIFDPAGSNKPLAPVLSSRLKQLPLGLRIYFQIMFSQERLKCQAARPGPNILLQYLSK